MGYGSGVSYIVKPETGGARMGITFGYAHRYFPALLNEVLLDPTFVQRPHRVVLGSGKSVLIKFHN